MAPASPLRRQGNVKINPLTILVSVLIPIILLILVLLPQVMINEEGARHEPVPSASWWIKWDYHEGGGVVFLLDLKVVRRGGSRWLEVGGAPGPPDDWSKAAGSTKLSWTTADQLNRNLFHPIFHSWSFKLSEFFFFFWYIKKMIFSHISNKIPTHWIIHWPLQSEELCQVGSCIKSVKISNTSKTKCIKT